MKRRIAALFVLVLALIAAFIVGCVDDTHGPQEIELSFDKDTAYFTSQTELYPIKGEEPADEDPTENATVKISADVAVRMVLTVRYEENQQYLEGLMVIVNGGSAQEFTDGTVLYISDTAETQAEVDLTIYLEKGSPVTNAGKTLSFELELSALE